MVKKKSRRTTPSSNEKGSAKTRQDMKRLEETDDCFILDFDPSDSLDSKRLTFSGDKDIVIIHETGQVACRDYPHPRHLCMNFPFGSISNVTHCDMCYCYVCDKPAPCAQWKSSHCNASPDSMDRMLMTFKGFRRRQMNLKKDIDSLKAKTEDLRKVFELLKLKTEEVISQNEEILVQNMEIRAMIFR